MVDIAHSGLTASIPGGGVAGGAAHTPGPWKICGNGPRAWHNGNIISTVTYDTVATCDRAASSVMDDGQLEANARLIAAAPDLLDALREARLTIAMLRRNVLTEISRHDGLFRWEGVPEALQGRIAECDEAIAKATGTSAPAEPKLDGYEAEGEVNQASLPPQSEGAR